MRASTPVLLALHASALPQATLGRSSHHCTAHDECWPSLKTWTEFNTSISGRLIKARPSAAVCHDPDYSQAACDVATANYTSSDWRTAQLGAYSGIIWEVGNEQCMINSRRSEPCQQGLVAPLMVNASCIEDIKASLRFASKDNLYLTVKNTGHDHLGRSSGDGAFGIWTHNMKGRTWHDSFVARGAPVAQSGIPAVTLQAGEQWLEVYRDADTHNRIVVGGSARTVGAVGGYMLGGGHSPWSHFYGLAVDNLLEISIVTPQGQHVVLNEYTDPDYFWAIRGGGGSSWGIVTSATYKTHPQPSHVQVALFQANMSSIDSYKTVYAQALRSIPALTDAGYTGYGSTTLGKTVQFIFLQPNGTAETLNDGWTGFEKLASMNGTADITAISANFTLPSWTAYREMFLSDPNIATNVQDASRLMTAEVLTAKADELVDLAVRFPSAAAGHNFVGKVNSAKRNQTSVHPIWAEGRTVMSYGIDWSDDATLAEKKSLKQDLVQISEELTNIVGPAGGTYINEANPYEPDWKNVFWGSNYERLESIKRRVDPDNLMSCNRCVGSDIVYNP